MGREGRKAGTDLLLEQIKEGDATAKFQAVAQLRQWGNPNAATVTSALVGLLASDEIPVRLQAAQLLGQLRQGKEAAVPVLTDILREPQSFYRIQAAQALAQFSGDNKDAIDALAAMLRDPMPTARHQAAQALAQMGPEGQKLALPTLLAMVNDPLQFARTQALQALAKMRGPAAKDAVAAIASRLDDPDRTLRPQALQALAQMGYEARSAIPTLAAHLKNDDPAYGPPGRFLGDPYGSPAHVLGQLGPGAVLPLVDAMKTTKGPALRELIDALGRIGPAARQGSRQSLMPSPTGRSSCGRWPSRRSSRSGSTPSPRWPDYWKGSRRPSAAPRPRRSGGSARPGRRRSRRCCGP